MRCTYVANLRNISLVVPTLAQAVVPRVGLGRIAQGARLHPFILKLAQTVCVSAIDSRGMHVNVGSDLGPDSARIGVSL